MSFENPTRVQIGMRASFGGKHYRVVGRSVLGENEGGETYYWNEYNLETDSGESATLVFDESERTSQWRLFTLFDPEYPMTAEDAASKQVGDRLNLTGNDVRISFRGSSCVYYVEGKAPEGEEVGTVAEYFNALSGSIMEVVSWTGDEIEFYNGINLSAGLVASAFDISPTTGLGERRKIFSSFSSGDDDGNSLSAVKFLIYGFIAIFLFVIVFGRGCNFSSSYENAPVARLAAPSEQLRVGAAGTLFDKSYRITGHTVVEIATVGVNWERHEYELTDDYGRKHLLVCGEKPDGSNWTVYELLSPLIAPTATETAAKKVGDTIDLDGYNGKVTDILLSTVQRSDGFTLNAPPIGSMSYGLRAISEYNCLLARWNVGGIQFFRGRAIPGKTAVASFK